MDRDSRRGARLNGAPLEGQLPKDEIEILSFEATDRRSRRAGCGSRRPGVPPADHGLARLSLCHLAAGRVDAVCSLAGACRRHRSRAALVRERGLAIDLFDAPPFGSARSTWKGVHASPQRNA
jgi:hypothetical protein